MKGNKFSSSMFASLFVIVLGLCYCSRASSQLSLGIPQLFGPSEALVETVADLNCKLPTYPQNETVLQQLFREGDRSRLFSEYTSLDAEEANFPLYVQLYHEGNLECVASAQNNSLIEPTVSNIHYLKVIEPVEGAEVEVRSELMEFFEGNTLELRCKLKAGNHVSYKWLLNGRLVSQSPLHDDRLLINRTTSQDSGSYMCVASNSFNQTQFFTSNSSEVVITVKDLVSNPDISFTLLKEDFHNYSAVVSCQSTQGTPPVTFSLYNGTEFIASATVEERNAAFRVPLVLGQHQGFLQCQARNGDRVAYSKTIPLEVVPVGGPVAVHYNFDSGENYAVIGLTFYCKAAKGTHSQYQWFLNDTLLPDRGSFYYVVHQPPEQSMLMLSVGWNSTGTYHCKVSDSFDNTTAISSKRLYVDKRVLNRLPIWVEVVVFGSFTVVVLLVSVCCGIGVVFRRRHYGEKSLLDFEMERIAPAYYGNLDLSHYNEDADVVNAARGGEDDQASLVSVDEWPQIEEEKKTLEDEPAEEP